MLCLLVKSPLKKSAVKKADRAYYELFTTQWGEICIFRLSHKKGSLSAEKKLRQIITHNIYTNSEPIPQEYIQTLSVYFLEQKLRENRNKTVCLSCPHITEEQLNNICLLSKAVYFVGEKLPEFSYDIYRRTGVMPMLCNNRVDAHFYNEPPLLFNTILPDELSSICPKEFSPTLFAGLLYKENGVMIK
ncbi:MAG: hypothetical protein U0M42_09515 [Acutalibacteraceae bacterium]|nr:hypothetical protein [Acutalibacteraceae bacterium]